MRALGDPHLRRHLSSVKTIALLLLLLCVSPLGAQQTLAPPTTSAVGQLPPSRPSPLGYFARSLLVPGWGQAALDRKLTGGLFIAFEGLALGMMLKAHTELRHLERTGSARVEDKRNERQDWLVLLGANHLFAGLEAFVAANLYDFPGDLRARPLPSGGTGIGLQFSLP